MLAYRGASLDQSFDMRARMRCSRVDDKPMMGAFMGALICPAAARMMGQLGLDFILLDWEHTPFGTLHSLDAHRI